MGRARFDEEEDIWKLGPSRPTSGPLGKRPVSAAGARRPVSEYARYKNLCIKDYCYFYAEYLLYISMQIKMVFIAY